jgi:hypothetical protein
MASVRCASLCVAAVGQRVAAPSPSGLDAAAGT